MTVELLLFDAAMIGVLACVLGLALGDVLSIAVFHATPAISRSRFPSETTGSSLGRALVLAVAAGMVAAGFGVLWPVREILARPLQGRGTSGRWPSLVGGAARRSACWAWRDDSHLGSSIPRRRSRQHRTGVALVCLLPFLFDALVSLFERASRVFDGVSSALAVVELQTPQTRVRSLAIAATAAVAVFGIVEFQGSSTNLKSGLGSRSRDARLQRRVYG